MSPPLIDWITTPRIRPFGMLHLAIVLIMVSIITPAFGEQVGIKFGGNMLNAQLNDRCQQISKRCLINLRGVECPDNRRVTVGELDNLIIAGLGYDRFSHDIQPPVLLSNPSRVFESPRVESHSSLTNTVSDFYSMVYPTTTNSKFYNGLYAHNGNADQMFNTFFSGDFNVANAQKQYLTHGTNVLSNSALTPDFTKIIDLLPEAYDDSLYSMIITYFGDSVLTAVEYGGVVDSTVSIRSCFSDANMEKYVMAELSNLVGMSEEKIPLGYAKYHKVSQLDIVGGNVQEENISKRIQSFKHNPVPIKFDSIPIWTVFPNGPKRQNMKRAVDNYVNLNSNKVNEMITRLNYLRDLEAFVPTPFIGYTKPRRGFLSEFGRGQVAGNNQADVGSLSYIYYGRKPTQAQGRATIRILRHRDDSFHVQVDTNYSPLKSFALYEPVVVNSSPAKNACITLDLPGIYPKVVDGTTLYIGYKFEFDSVIVCHGCNPQISGGLTIGACPSTAKPCPPVQQVK